MSLRLDTATFAQICVEEWAHWRDSPEWRERAEMVSVAIDTDPDEWPLARRDNQVIYLRKKPIQSLVNSESALREIVSNLIRWGLEQGGA